MGAQSLTFPSGLLGMPWYHSAGLMLPWLASTVQLPTVLCSQACGSACVHRFRLIHIAWLDGFQDTSHRLFLRQPVCSLFLSPSLHFSPEGETRRRRNREREREGTTQHPRGPGNAARLSPK